MNMKNNRIILILLAGILAFTGCKKDDSPIREEFWSQIEAVPAVMVKIDNSGSQAIDLTNLPGFSGKFNVSMYFAGAKTPPKVDIVVRKNGSNTNVKLFQANVTTFPSAFTVTSAQIAALFGTAILLGDTYDFGADVYTEGGSKYETFPLGSIGAASGPVNQPGYSQFVRYGAICAYNPTVFQGNFTVLQDDWDEFAPGETVTVTQVSANQFSIRWNTPHCTVANPIPVVFTVNTGNLAIKVDPRAQMGDSYGWAPANYGRPYITVVENVTQSFVEPCAQRITFTGAYSVDLGSFSGTYKTVLQK
jgi:uncharacterized protein YaiE (UPF0345 family)